MPGCGDQARSPGEVFSRVEIPRRRALGKQQWRLDRHTSRADAGWHKGDANEDDDGCEPARAEKVYRCHHFNAAPR